MATKETSMKTPKITSKILLRATSFVSIFILCLSLACSTRTPTTQYNDDSSNYDDNSDPNNDWSNDDSADYSQYDFPSFTTNPGDLVNTLPNLDPDPLTSRRELFI